MAIEIERKFLVNDEQWREDVQSSLHMRQAYIASASASTVRIRTARTLSTQNSGQEQAWLTLKGATAGLAKLEFEYPIPPSDAIEIMQKLTDSDVIEKTRHLLCFSDNEWVIDEFHASNDGLLVAEIELTAEDHRFELPPWAGAEVTQDHRYSNKYLSVEPWTRWRSNAAVTTGNF